MEPHIVLFPFMSKGHTIPLLHLCRLLLRRGVQVTIFTTAQNRFFISQHLPEKSVTIINLPFPENIPGIPVGTESTDKLPSMSLLAPFMNATKSMQPFFEEELEKNCARVDCVVSDGFLYWTLESATKFGIPRLSFYGMSYYTTTTCHEAISKNLISFHESPDEEFALPSFPWIKLTRNHFPFDKPDPFVMEAITATNNSYGLLVNSFYKLEKTYIDYYDSKRKPKAWSVGPLCLAQPSGSTTKCTPKPEWIHWLDQKLEQNRPVLYVAFGSQAEVSQDQLNEISQGLEEANVGFLWVLRENGVELSEGFEDRVKERGIIVKEWVDQNEILEHEIVKGFLSHCGWNSVMDGICAEVPILAWPLTADQHLNGKMVEEEIKIGLRAETADRTVRGFVTWDSLKKAAVELMEGDRGKELRESVKKVAEEAREAVAEGGSSWKSLNQLVDKIYRTNGTFGCPMSQNPYNLVS